MLLSDWTKSYPIIAGVIPRLPHERIAPKHEVTAAYRQELHSHGLDYKRFITGRQVHGCEAHIVTLGDVTRDLVCDGLVTRDAMLGVGIVTADCLPVLFFDGNATVVAAAHAGWRGLAGGILEATVKAMSMPHNNIHAYIGAAICQDCFEVGPEVAEAFVECDTHIKPGRGDRVHIDLYGIATQQLQSLGIQNITQSSDCTRCLHGKYWSHRHHGWQRGNQLTFIALPGGIYCE